MKKAKNQKILVEGIGQISNIKQDTLLSKSSLSIFVDIRDPGWTQKVTDPEAQCLKAAQTVFLKVATFQKQSEASIVLTDDKFIRELNFRYRGIDAKTNVLAFASSEKVGPDIKEAPIQLGDIVIARETVISESLELSLRVTDHLCHLTIHGMLHLLGFDHHREVEARKMEKIETACLASLGVADPHGRFRNQDY